jgi:hypothetical protein
MSRSVPIRDRPNGGARDPSFGPSFPVNALPGPERGPCTTLPAGAVPGSRAARRAMTPRARGPGPAGADSVARDPIL